jgi:Acyclic terpene utilisation family protein AtuA
LIRIANCSGFYGDRFSAAREMLEGGPIDVLTGDYLAELTMLILWKTGGYARTFVRQMEDVLGLALEQGVKVVANAGGLDPGGCAEAVRALGTGATIAHVEGDDLRERFPGAVTANAYLGAFGIAEALERGADVVVTGRVTDASLVVGPAAWRLGWGRDDLDQLAGAVVTGHVLECGAHATGGNFAFFREVPGLEHPGFPIAEVEEDGSATITKHRGTGGLVSIDTVTAQLLYEIDGPRYLGPDVVARFDTIRLDEDGSDRVRISGVRGEPPPATLKVAVNEVGGYRNSMTFVLTGLERDAKARLVRDTLRPRLEGIREVDWRLRECGDEAELTLTVKDPEEAKVGRAFTAAVVELALASYPGFHTTTPPADASPFGVYRAEYVPAASVEHRVVL